MIKEVTVFFWTSITFGFYMFSCSRNLHLHLKIQIMDIVQIWIYELMQIDNIYPKIIANLRGGTNMSAKCIISVLTTIFRTYLPVQTSHHCNVLVQQTQNIHAI